MSNIEWRNEWCIYIALYCVLLYTQSTLHSCGGGLSSTTTSVQWASLGGGGGRGLGLKLVWFRYMKNRVNILKGGGGSFESHRHRTEHFRNYERSNKFGSQFTWGESEVKVLRGQPDLLIAHVKWGLSTVTVRRRLVLLASPGEGFLGGPPSTEASLNERMRGWNNSVGFLGGE